MPTESDNVIHQLAAGAAAIGEIVERAHTSDDVPTVVAAAMFTPDPQQLMARAHQLAVTTRDRQLVEIATAHLAGDGDRVTDLARDHLADHPDSVVAAWITSASHHITPQRTERP